LLGGEKGIGRLVEGVIDGRGGRGMRCHDPS
jgi:hypothetical protein